ncbi:MAG: nucleoside deaminase [Melioribacteraceae bacterium]|jgi:tRNA(Arg) A34 adenosine deaminase TadA|nr:nucleoside deaminase [Melioribacteraceae bacterium]
MTTSKTIALPNWVNEIDKNVVLNSIDDKMNFVLDLAIKNITMKTGGPFAAAIFNQKTNELVSVGLNVVVENNCSVAHAEVVAIINAEEKLKRFRLDDTEYELISSAQPCVMCNGAVLWSGVTKLAYGANKDDVEKIVGFDEGPLHPNWIEEFKQRGITVEPNILNEKSREVLQLYKDNEGILY